MSENPRHDDASWGTPMAPGPLNGNDLPKKGAEVSGSAWMLGDADLGCSEGPSYADQHLVDGQIQMAQTLVGRQDVPYEHDFHVMSDVNGAPGRVDVADPNPDCGVPDPFAGDAGQPLPWGEVAPVEQMDRQLNDESLDLDGQMTQAETGENNVAAPGVPGA